MNATCRSCNKTLRLSKKIIDGLNKLEPGMSIKLKCPECGEAIILDSTIKEKGAISPTSTVQPPGPPDITWLIDGVFDDEEIVEDVPMALVLMPDIPGRDTVVKGVESIGYQAELMTSAREAIEKMQFVNYASVVLHSRFESKKLPHGSFHNFMAKMHMSNRRNIFYILIGPEFNTFYNLQALSHSANLVVNDRDVEKFDVILRKAIPEYEALFGPIMEELRLQGK